MTKTPVIKVEKWKDIGPMWERFGNAGKFYSGRIPFESVRWLYHVMNQKIKAGAEAGYVPVLMVRDLTNEKMGRKGRPTHKLTNPYWTRKK